MPVGINSNGTAKDKDGKTLAAGDLYIDVVGPGETGIGSFYFDTDKDVATVDYKLSYDTDVYYIPVVSDLSTEEVQNDEDVVVTVTNNGDAAAQYVNVYCLFFDKKDNVIGSDWSYATDSDSEIKPGESQSVQLKNYDKFDHYKIFMTGYRYE